MGFNCYKTNILKELSGKPNIPYPALGTSLWLVYCRTNATWHDRGGLFSSVNFPIRANIYQKRPCWLNTCRAHLGASFAKKKNACGQLSTTSYRACNVVVLLAFIRDYSGLFRDYSGLLRYGSGLFHDYSGLLCGYSGLFRYYMGLFHD